MEQPITYVGRDVHKDTIAAALADAGKRHGGARPKVDSGRMTRVSKLSLYPPCIIPHASKHLL